MKELTTTSYTILSLLAIRPWSGYELAQEMRRNASRFWPRAERGVYDEPKNLVAHGLAEARQEAVGRRARTAYRITPRGRRALSAWLATPLASEHQLESEAVVRVAFAENGDAASLLATLETLAEQMAEQHAFAMEVATAYADGEGRYPDRAHLIALVVRYLADHYRTTEEWTQWAREQVLEWGDVRAAPQPDVARELMAETLRRGRRPAPRRRH